MARVQNHSTKRLQIDKANARMLTVVIVASVLTVFSLMATRALLGQRSYQARVIEQKQIARDQLESNLKAVDNLLISYETFVGSPENIIKGSSSGKGSKDGDNAKIILDALPSKYDFPALTTSVEKLLRDRGFQINSISGVDDEIAQQDVGQVPSPEPIEIPFEFDVTGGYAGMKDLVRDLSRSIRPIHILNLNLNGDDEALNMHIEAKTYYQPGRSLSIEKRVVQ